jgi:diguanylate cyclase
MKMQQRLNDALEAVMAVNEGTAVYDRALAAALGDRASAETQKSAPAVRAATIEMGKRLNVFEHEIQLLAGDASRFMTRLNDSRQVGMTDPLTGFQSRDGFDISLREAIAELAIHDEPISILLCNVDELSQLRQSWGDEICDQVLRLVGRRLSEETKSGGSAARFAGDEFALLLKRGALVEAIRLAAKIRADLQSRTLVRKSTGERLGKIALSVGVAQFAEGESSTDLTRRAEECLDLARRLGRNIIVGENDPRFTQSDIDAA